MSETSSPPNARGKKAYWNQSPMSAACSVFCKEWRTTSGDSASALPARSNGPTETVAAADEKERATAVKRLPVADADEKELTTAAKRFLVAEIDRLVEENQQLRQFKEKYHDVDKKLAVLKEMTKRARRNTFLSSACLIAGSAGIATAPTFLSITQYGWYVFVSVSTMLLIAGIAARIEGPSGPATRQPGSPSK